MQINEEDIVKAYEMSNLTLTITKTHTIIIDDEEDLLVIIENKTGNYSVSLFSYVFCVVNNNMLFVYNSSIIGIDDSRILNTFIDKNMVIECADGFCRAYRLFHIKIRGMHDTYNNDKVKFATSVILERLNQVREQFNRIIKLIDDLEFEYQQVRDITKYIANFKDVMQESKYNELLGRLDIESDNAVSRNNKSNKNTTFFNNVTCSGNNITISNKTCNGNNVTINNNMMMINGNTIKIIKPNTYIINGVTIELNNTSIHRVVINKDNVIINDKVCKLSINDDITVEESTHYYKLINTDDRRVQLLYYVDKFDREFREFYINFILTELHDDIDSELFIDLITGINNNPKECLTNILDYFEFNNKSIYRYILVCSDMCLCDLFKNQKFTIKNESENLIIYYKETDN